MVGWLVSLSVGWSFRHDFLNGRKVTLPCSYRSTCYSSTLIFVCIFSLMPRTQWLARWLAKTSSTGPEVTGKQVQGVCKYCFFLQFKMYFRLWFPSVYMNDDLSSEFRVLLSLTSASCFRVHYCFVIKHFFGVYGQSRILQN